MTPPRTLVAFIRHGRTEWNVEGRIQGHTDTPLSPEGTAELGRYRAPGILDGSRWHTSPLIRAVDTARALGPGAFRLEPRLIEMRWGEWEGQTLAGLRARLGDAMLANEARGLHFKPQGGESPADVQARLQEWFREIAARGHPVTAISHKGVIRAVLSLAYGWDMTGRAPVRLTWNAAHLFEVSTDGAIAPVEMNVPFEEISCPDA